MDSFQLKKELRRLRHDFEKHSSRYYRLSLSIYFIVAGEKLNDVKFCKPNHAINLWQYMGQFYKDSDNYELLNFKLTEFGLTNSLVSAYGVIEGKNTDLFVRMAIRTGSLLENIDPIVMKIIMKNFVDDKWLGKPIFVSNSDPLARWLNLTLMCVSTFQPGRFRNNILAVDPFTASLSVFDHLLDNLESIQDMSPFPIESKQFKVALSFPGEKRKFVEEVAYNLQETVGDIFYDRFFQDELAKPNLDLLLQKIYHKNSLLIVVFLCKEYSEKEWCGLEWRAIRDLMKKGKDNSIMLMRFDNCEISGLFSIDGFIDLSGQEANYAVDLIRRRLSKMVTNLK